MKLSQFRSICAVCGFAWIGGTGGETPVVPDSVTSLLIAAVSNQYRGEYSAEVVFVRESFTGGTDSLRGRLTINDPVGERQIKLQGQDEAAEWWSRNFGQEQWWKDEKSDRVHRIPYRSLKKPAFGSLLTYEDLLKWPADYLLNFQSCQKLAETESTIVLSLLLKPVTQSRYGYLDVTLSKRPVLLQRLVFFNADGHRLKSLEVAGYRPEGGKYLATGLRVYDSDSLSSLQMTLLNPKVSQSLAARQDKTSTSQAAVLSRILGHTSNEVKLEATDAEDMPESAEKTEAN